MIEETTKQWIKDRLVDSEFLVEFTKKDGIKRKMRCTLAEGYVPPPSKDPLTQKKVRAVNEEVQVVWDMELVYLNMNYRIVRCLCEPEQITAILFTDAVHCYPGRCQRGKLKMAARSI